MVGRPKEPSTVPWSRRTGRLDARSWRRRESARGVRKASGAVSCREADGGVWEGVYSEKSLSDAAVLSGVSKVHALRAQLSWTHYRRLMRIPNQEQREFYMNAAADEHWTSRQLDHQIATFYRERLLSSQGEKRELIRPRFSARSRRRRRTTSSRIRTSWISSIWVVGQA